MKKIYLLNSCSTCQRILSQIGSVEGLELQNIKEKNIDEKMLDWLKDKVGSYEALFSKKAMKYRAMGLHEQTLSETDYRRLMLEEYTFLKRPFMINGEAIFIGNTSKVVDEAVKSFHQ
jgi:arsenate reductase-like glutaredoxin family protein